MTDYFVRKSGSDGAAGTSAGAAWLTIGKALGATGIASGDTVYIGAGTYRETVQVAMTSAVAETFVIGDVDGVKTGDSGEIIWTAYTTNDTTIPASSSTLDLAGTDFLTFRYLTLISGSGATCVGATSTTSTNIKFQDCNLLGHPGIAIGLIFFVAAFGVALNLTIERCYLRGDRNSLMKVQLNTGAGADYDANVVIRNCVLDVLANSAAGIEVSSSGAGAQEGGGVYIYNCIVRGPSSSSNVIRTNGTQVGGATWAFPVRIYNSIIVGGIASAESGAIVENYNHIMAQTTHTNVTLGANTKTNSTYSYLVNANQERAKTVRAFGEPMAGSPYLGFGNDGTYTSSEDLRGNPRPAGGATATKGIGAYERGNTFAKETGTVRTGSNAISITGPGYQDFQLPVAASSTTVTVYVRWDATYAGTKPKMQVLNGTEAGVADATATATGSSGAWEQLSLNFTPTSAGIVTIRLLSSDTNGGGKMFADDFSVA